MEIANKEIKTTQKEEERVFSESQIVLKNRKQLNISGVEKVYEANASKIQLRASASNLMILGENLSVERLSVEEGVIEISGLVCEFKFNSEGSKNFLKKIFK